MESAKPEVMVGADGTVKRRPSRGMYLVPSLFTAEIGRAHV